MADYDLDEIRRQERDARSSVIRALAELARRSWDYDGNQEDDTHVGNAMRDMVGPARDGVDLLMRRLDELRAERDRLRAERDAGPVPRDVDQLRERVRELEAACRKARDAIDELMGDTDLDDDDSLAFRAMQTLVDVVDDDEGGDGG